MTKPLHKQVILTRICVFLFLGLVIAGLGTAAVTEMMKPLPSLEQMQLDEQQECIDLGGIPAVIPNPKIVQGYQLVCTHEETVIKKGYDK